jgi:hypothetical protein
LWIRPAPWLWANPTALGRGPKAGLALCIGYFFF